MHGSRKSYFLFCLCACVEEVLRVNQDVESAYVQAIMAGPFVMAGMTDGSRLVVAEPESVAARISNAMPSMGLVSLRVTPRNTSRAVGGAQSYLRRVGQRLAVGLPGKNLMEATFRLVDVTKR